MTFEIPGTMPRDVVLDGEPQFFLSLKRGGVALQSGVLKCADVPLPISCGVGVGFVNRAGVVVLGIKFFGFN